MKKIEFNTSKPQYIETIWGVGYRFKGMMEVKILYEDAQLIVCVKPPGMSSQAERSSSMDLVSWLKNYLAAKQKGGGPGKKPLYQRSTPLGPACGRRYGLRKNSESGGRAEPAVFGTSDQKKTYLALLTGRLPKASGSLVDHLEKDGRTNTSAVVGEGGRKASLDYRELEEKDGLSLVEVRLHTGRHHQIRVQTAHAGAGIYGGYGSITVKAQKNGMKKKA